ncbi:MAG: hypothetical protein ABI906_07190 [Pseudomonadota bacterium]
MEGPVLESAPENAKRCPDQGASAGAATVAARMTVVAARGWRLEMGTGRCM